MALVTCQICKQKHEKSEMECHEKVYESGQIVRKYYHKGECWNSFLIEKDFIDIELQERDYLNDIIKQLHGIDLVPSQFFSSYLQGLRNGNFKMGKKNYKYKEGFRYKLIADTYMFCRDSIKWARENRKFDGTMAELKYCLAIIVDKIQVVKKRQEKTVLKKKIEAEKAVGHVPDEPVSKKEVKFKKKENAKDISGFLD